MRVLLIIILIIFSIAFASASNISADFIAEDRCLGKEVQFQNQSSTLSGNIILHVWDFGDGSTSNSVNPKHRYDYAGQFNVSLTVFDEFGGFDRIIKSVEVYQSPVANFEVPPEICFGEKVILRNLSLGGTTYLWDFGNGESSTDEEPDIAYQTPGSYQVELRVENGFCEKIFRQTITVNDLPEADFSVSDACQSEELDIVNQSTGTDLNYSWTVDNSFVSSDRQPELKLSIPGTYDIGLIAVNSSGCSDTTKQQLEVFKKPQVEFDIEDHCLGTLMSLDNRTDHQQVLSFEWQFGDGSESTEIAPEKVYAATGHFQVKLNAETENGCRDSLTKSVHVYPQPKGFFSISDACQGDFVKPTNIFSGINDEVNYQWDFGDGSLIDSEKPQYRYISPGEYRVDMLISTKRGCADTVSNYVNISPIPLPGTLYGDTLACGPLRQHIKLILKDYEGEVIQWERKHDVWEVINNKDDTLIIEQITKSYKYRVLIGNGNCEPVYSNLVRVDYQDLPFAGRLNGPSEICEAFDSLKFNITDATVQDFQWQIRVSSEWLNLAEQGRSITLANPGSDFSIRAIGLSGTCPSDTTDQWEVDVFSQPEVGIILGPESYCTSNDSLRFHLSSHSGKISWEIAESRVGPWQTLNTSSETLILYNLDKDFLLRAVSTNGLCNGAISIIHEVRRISPSKAGVVTGQRLVCAQNQVLEYHSDSYTGSLLGWVVEEDSITWISSTMGNNLQVKLDTIQANNLSIQYVVKNQNCPADTSALFSTSIASIPITNFRISDACGNDELIIENRSTIESGFIDKYEWYLNEKLVSNAPLPALDPEVGSHLLELKAISDQGCVSSHQSRFSISEAPSIDFRLNDICEYDSLEVESGSDSTYYLEWWVGDELVTTNTSLILKDLLPGSYEVQLKATDSLGCSSSRKKTINVYHQPQIDWQVYDHCFGTQVQPEINLDNFPDISYLWNFNGDTTISEKSPAYSFDQPGEKQVTLQLTSVNGCSSQTTETITVHQLPAADFTVSDLCLDSILIINNRSDGESLSYLWYQEDNIVSTDSLPKLRAKISGRNTLKLIVENQHTCTDSMTRQYEVVPVATAFFESELNCQEEVSVFKVPAIDDHTINWRIDSLEYQVHEDLEYRFREAGLHFVEVRFTNSLGCFSEYNKEVYIPPKPLADFAFTNACEGDTVRFTPVVNPGFYQHNWIFDQEATSVAYAPSRYYDWEGQYQVQHQVVSSDGCRDTVTQEVQVYREPIADFSASDGCIEESLFVENKSWVSGDSRYQWYIDDTISLREFEPVLYFSEPGLHSLKLEVTTGENCYDQVQKTIQINERPSLFLADTLIKISKGDHVMLAVGGASEYSWQPVHFLSHPFSENTIAAPDSSMIYTVYGRSNLGCESSEKVSIEVLDDYKLVPHNVLTPDGDGVNDFWIIENADRYSDVAVKVYDRNGRIVFQDRSYQNNWNGYLSNHLLPDGTYFYSVTTPVNSFKGSITILRQ